MKARRNELRKIISLFQRNYETDYLVRDETVPGAEWVIAGDGVATRKFDGTCCMIRNGRLYKRYDAKKGKKPPANFEPAQSYDEVTGHMPGWIPVEDGPEDRWHREAFEVGMTVEPDLLTDGTFELCGPKIQGNPEGFDRHVLVPHGRALLPHWPRTYSGIREAFERAEPMIEGVVWHHPDGRMVKIKAKDFGIKRNAQNQP